MERDHGRIVSVSTRTLGSVLDGDHAAGATSLVLFDAGDFDETGGTLSVNGATLAYASVDDDADIITLSDPLPADALDGDFVACWDTLYDTASTVKTAMVQLDGDDDNPDPIEATVPHFLADKLADGDRGGPGETVVIGYEEEDDEWHVLDVLGLSARASGGATRFYDKDSFTVTSPGAQSFTLTHEPIDGSVHMIWDGLDQPSSEFTLSGSNISVPDPSGVIEAGHLIDFKYAYLANIPSSYLLDWGSGGWKYLQVAQNDTVDRSGVGFDDSTWSDGSAPFADTPGTPYRSDTGASSSAPPGTDQLLTPESPFPTQTNVWLRKTLTGIPTGTRLLISVRIDNNVEIYWNGALVGSGGTSTWWTTVTATVIAAGSSNLLAIKAMDDTAHDTGDQAYCDIRVEQAA